MSSLLPRTALVALAATALVLPGAAVPVHAATVLDTATYKVSPSGKKTRFQLLLKDEGVVVLTFAVKKRGAFKVLDRAQVHGLFTDGSTQAEITDLTQDYEGAPENGGQGLLAWEGATDEEDYAEYFGFSVKTGELDLYGG